MCAEFSSLLVICHVTTDDLVRGLGVRLGGVEALVRFQISARKIDERFGMGREAKISEVVEQTREIRVFAVVEPRSGLVLRNDCPASGASQAKGGAESAIDTTPLMAA